MKSFTFYRPQNAEAAVRLLDAKWGTSELLAGGTDLISLQKDYVARPDKVVSLGSIKALAGISGLDKEPPVITIGAGTKLADIAADTGLRKYVPALTTAAGD